MRRCRDRLGRRPQGQTVLAGAEDVLDRPKAIGAEGQRAGARRLEPEVPVPSPQLHDPQTGAIPLLGVRAALQDPTDELSGLRPDLLNPADQPRRRPFGMRAVGAGHVLGHGRRLSVVAPAVRHDALAAMEDLDRVGGVADLDLLADQLVRHAVDVALDLDVVVDVDAAQLPVREDVARSGQGPQRRAVELLVEGAAADAELLNRPVVQRVEQDADRRVERAELEEGLVAESGEDPPLCHEYAVLDGSLVAGLSSGVPGPQRRRSGAARSS